MRFLRIIPCAAFAALLVSCAEQGTQITEPIDSPLFAEAGNSGPSVNGRGVISYNDVRCPSTFYAREHKDGSVTGTLQSNCPAQTLVAHGIFDCLVVDGNEAILGGVLTKVSTGPDTPAWFTADVGTRFWLKVRDNGEGRNAPPDEWTDWYPALPQFGLYSTVCGETPWVDDPFIPELEESESANIQVKP